MILVALALLAVATAGVVFHLRSDDGGASSAERSACVAVQDTVDDIRARASLPTLISDAAQAGRAANAEADSTLAKDVRSLRIAFGIFNARAAHDAATSTQPVNTALTKVEDECGRLGVKIR